LIQHIAASKPVVLHLHDAFTICARSFRVPRAGVQCPQGGGQAECAACLSPDLVALGGDLVETLLMERRALLKAECAAASAVIAPSSFHARLIATELGIAEPQVIPHGLCLEANRAPITAVEEARRFAGPLRLLHAGNRTTVKGCLELAFAVAELPEGSVHLRFVGREVEPGIDARLRAIGGEFVSIDGPFEASDWTQLAVDHDLCLLPSRAAESYGLVADEALAHGLPTWVSDRGALPERVAQAAAIHVDAGRVLPAESPKTWTAALAELVEFPRRLHDARRLMPPMTRTVRTSALELETLDRELVLRSRACAFTSSVAPPSNV